jgi:protein-tyrosine phosphatase
MNHFDKIIDSLYLGGASFVYADILPHFSLIINLCPEINCDYSSVSHDKILFLKVLDSKEENEKLIDLIEKEKVMELIQSCISKRENVLVHCAMGVSRSASLVASYLCFANKMDVKEACKLIREKRPQCFTTGFHFVKTMKYFSIKSSCC